MRIGAKKLFRTSDSEGNHYLVKAYNREDAYNQIRIKSTAKVVYSCKRA